MNNYMLVVRDIQNGYKIIYHASDEMELSYWMKRYNIDYHNIIVDHVPRAKFYRETEEEIIIKNRDIVIDRLLKNRDI